MPSQPSPSDRPARGTPSLAAKLGLAIAAASIMVALTVAAGEALFRHRERTRGTVPGTFPTLYYRHNRLEHALRRGFDYFGWVQINESGFRGEPLDTTHAGRRFRIMVVGSSTVFDVGVSANQNTWPSRLQQELLAAGIQTEVINAGVPGYWLTDNLIRLHTELREHAPDLLLLYEGHNDVIGTLARLRRILPPHSEERPGEIRTAGALRRWLELNSMFYGKLAGRMEAISFRTSEPRFIPFDSVLIRSIPQWESNYRAFFALSRAHGIPLVTSSLVKMDESADSAVVASWRLAMPYATTAEVLMAYDSLDAAMRRAAQAEGVRVVETRDFTLGAARWYVELDPVHFNDAGSAEMARQMSRALISAGVLAADTAARAGT